MSSNSVPRNSARTFTLLSKEDSELYIKYGSIKPYKVIIMLYVKYLIGTGNRIHSLEISQHRREDYAKN